MELARVQSVRIHRRVRANATFTPGQKSLSCIDLRGRATSRIFCFETRHVCCGPGWLDVSVRKSVGTRYVHSSSAWRSRVIHQVTCSIESTPASEAQRTPRAVAHARPRGGQPVGIRDDRLHLFDRVTAKRWDHRLSKAPPVAQILMTSAHI